MATLTLNPDFSDMLNALSAESVAYLLVGGYAMAAHGLPRATGDIDFWVKPTTDNSERVWQALKRFGAPLAKMSPADFAVSDIVYQLGRPPFRMDFLTSIDGVDFDDAWKDRHRITIGENTVWVISRKHLAQNKRTVGHPQDVADVAMLERQPKRKGRKR